MIDFNDWREKYYHHLVYMHELSRLNCDFYTFCNYVYENSVFN